MGVFYGIRRIGEDGVVHKVETIMMSCFLRRGYDEFHFLINFLFPTIFKKCPIKTKNHPIEIGWLIGASDGT